MAYINFVRGLKENYNYTTHQDAIYFATDTYEIIMNSISYGGGGISNVEFNDGKLIINLIDGSSKEVEIPDATDENSGLMSAEDKASIEEVKSRLETITVDTELSNTSENPVQNKVITEALEGKQNVGDYVTSDILDDYVTEIELEAKGYQTEEQCIEAVNSAVANLVDSAPETLDTLKELADALGNDANFSTTVTTLIGQKLDTETYETDKETFALKTEIPTNVGELNNDAGYITESMAKLCDITLGSQEAGYITTDMLSNIVSELDDNKIYYISVYIDEYPIDILLNRVSNTPLFMCSYLYYDTTDYYNYSIVVCTSDIYGDQIHGYYGIKQIPEKTSQLQNDSDFITSTSVNKIEAVTELPESPDSNTLYLIVS